MECNWSDESAREASRAGQFDSSWFGHLLNRIDNPETTSNNVQLPYDYMKSVVNANYKIHLEIES